jgi:hypothetical protein
LGFGVWGLGFGMGGAGAGLGATAEPFGPLSQFWDEDHYYENPDAVRRRLVLANRPLVRGEQRASGRRASGLLPDDTTIAVVRRRHEER